MLREDLIELRKFLSVAAEGDSSEVLAKEERELGDIILNYPKNSEEFKRARNRLVVGNIKLVPYFVNMLTSRKKLDYQELLSAGVIGLMNAANNFNPNKGRFSHYAGMWIRQAVQRNCGNYFSLIYYPELLLETLCKIEHREEELYDYNDPSEIARIIKKEFNISDNKYKKYKELIDNRYTVSLDETCGTSEDDDNLYNIFTGKDYDDTAQEIIFKESVSMLLRKNLKPKEHYVIVHTYGLEDQDQMYDKDIAKVLNVSVKTVSNIRARSLKKIKPFFEDLLN